MREGVKHYNLYSIVRILSTYEYHSVITQYRQSVYNPL